jgi:hypothetical protein
MIKLKQEEEGEKKYINLREVKSEELWACERRVVTNEKDTSNQ